MRLSFIICSAILLAGTINASAQTPDEALRNSWYIPGGTARAMATGGAMGSLGGDITSNNVNPAGLGLYKTNELVFSPGFMLNNNAADFRGTNSSMSSNAFAYGATGIVLRGPGLENSSLTSTAFSFSLNQLASYNNHIHYKGLNNYSSYAEQFIEELARDFASPTAAEQNYIYGSSLAYRTYLVDTSTANGQTTYFTLPNPSTGLMQEYDAVTSGSLNEASFNFAGSMNDKLFIGFSLNIPFASYRRDRYLTETDASGNAHNNFNSSTFTENYRSTGVGLNVKFGIIYKPQQNFRLGFAIHTPSFMWFTDKIRASMVTDTEDYAGVKSENSDNLNSGNPGESQYTLQTPMKAIASATYLFSAVQDTRKQRGFVTADVEYVGYGTSKFSASQDLGTDYYSTLNSATSDYLKGNINVRLGGELKLDPIAIRLGGGYYGSPYRDGQLKASRMQLGGGFGYRNHGLFIDLAYIQTFNKDVNFPYRLNDKANTYATINDSRGNIILTLGIKI